MQKTRSSRYPETHQVLFHLVYFIESQINVSTIKPLRIQTIRRFVFHITIIFYKNVIWSKFYAVTKIRFK